jgi:hypothetical protein
MSDAGHEPALPIGKVDTDRELDRIAEAYLSQADGDASAALLKAIADGRAVSSLVSRGFARWGAAGTAGRNVGDALLTHGRCPESPVRLPVRRRSCGLPVLSAARLLPPRAPSRAIWAGNGPRRPCRRTRARLPVASIDRWGREGRASTMRSAVPTFPILAGPCRRICRRPCVSSGSCVAGSARGVVCLGRGLPTAFFRRRLLRQNSAVYAGR